MVFRGIFKRKHQERIAIIYFNRKVKIELNELDTTIYFEANKIIESSNSQGVLNSPMGITPILKMLHEKFSESCDKILPLVEEFQEENHINISQKHLGEICSLIEKQYLSSYQKKVENTYKANVVKFLGEAQLENLTNNLHVNSIHNQLSNKIKNYFIDLQMKNYIQQDPPAIKIAKNSFYLSILSFLIPTVISLISLYFSVIKK